VTIYNWELGTAGSKCRKPRLKVLEDENARLKKLLAEAVLKISP
jgi:hypothetical protein